MGWENGKEFGTGTVSGTQEETTGLELRFYTSIPQHMIPAIYCSTFSKLESPFGMIFFVVGGVACFSCTCTRTRLSEPKLI